MHATVVGAGRMGSGIAQALASGGMDVALMDNDHGALESAVHAVGRRLDRSVETGAMDADAADAVRQRVHAGGLGDAADSDLVIEAVYEDLGTKRDLLGRLGDVCAADTVLATNTSSFRVAQLADACPHPERLAAMHFFYPGHQNPLVEIAAGPATGGRAIRVCRDAAARAGKHVIQTADANGFAVNRFLLPWANEACRLVDEGFDAGAVEDAAAQTFGIPYGPFTVMDLSGLPVCLHAMETLADAFGDFYAPARSLRRQAGLGPWRVTRRPDSDVAPVAERRLLGAAVGVAGRLVDEGVARADDVDTGARLGLQWPEGPFGLAKRIGGPVREAVRALGKTWPDAVQVPARLA